jgi:hypothetical protein
MFRGSEALRVGGSWSCGSSWERPRGKGSMPPLKAGNAFSSVRDILLAGAYPSSLSRPLHAACVQGVCSIWRPPRPGRPPFLCPSLYRIGTCENQPAAVTWTCSFKHAYNSSGFPTMSFGFGGSEEVFAPSNSALQLRAAKVLSRFCIHSFCLVLLYCAALASRPRSRASLSGGRSRIPPCPRYAW